MAVRHSGLCTVVQKSLALVVGTLTDYYSLKSPPFKIMNK